MVKYISVICRPPGTDRQQVIDYWMNVHAPLVKKCLPGLRKYVISFPVPSPISKDPPEYDGVVELYFNDVESMRKALTGPAWQSEERKASSNKVIDYSKLKGYYVEENAIEI